MKDKPKFLNGQIVWLLIASFKRMFKVEIVMYQILNDGFQYVIKNINKPGCGLLVVSERVLFRTRRGAKNKMNEIHEMVAEVIKEDEQRRR